jgi:flagellar biosynthesis/type III secretory pathway protein FliH
MTFVCVRRAGGPTLSTDRLVLAPPEVQRFADAHALADALAQLHDSEHQRIDAAQRAAHAAGHAQGLADGRRLAQQQGAGQLAEALGRLAQQSQVEQRALRDAVLTLSLLIVRRVAAELPRAQLLAALARQALDHVAAEQAQRGDFAAASPSACVVRLHPGVLDAVRAHLERDGASPAAIEWRADDQLEPLDCVLDTPGGRLLAGLEAQLERVQAVLRQSAGVARADDLEAASS